MNTKYEFLAAIKMIERCKATMTCGCEYDDMLADKLYYECKYYIMAYKRRVDEEIKKKKSGV